MKNLIGHRSTVLIFIALLSSISCKETEPNPSPEQVLQNIEITPNPFIDSFEIVINDQISGEMEYVVFNRFGQNIKSENFTINAQTQTSKKVDAKSLEEGVYILIIYFEGENVVKKIIKEES